MGNKEVKRQVKRKLKPEVKKGVLARTHWLTWVVWVGVALSAVGVTFANAVSSELTKTILLSWVVAFGVLVWFWLVVSRGAVGWRWHVLDLAVLAWLGVNMVAAWHSSLPRVSFWGFGDVYADGLVAVISMVGLYFLLVNLPGRFSLRLWMQLGVLVAALGSLAVLLTSFTPVTFSLLSRLASQTAVFLALILPLTFSLRLSAQSSWKKWLSLVGIILPVTALIILDQTVAWWVVIVVSGLWLLGQAWFAKTALIPRVGLVAGVMVLAVICLSVTVGVFQADVFFSTTDTWSIVTSHLSPIGVGQNNFVLLSAATSPDATTFVTLASSSLLGWLISLGVLGVMSWVAVVACATWCVVRMWNKARPTQEQWGTASALVGVVMAACLLPLGFVSLLLFWLLLAALHRSIWSPTHWVIKSYQAITNLSLLGMAVSAVILVLAFWVGGRELAAQVHYWRGQQLFVQGEDNTLAAEQLQAAEQLAPQQAEYNFALAELLLIQQQSTPQAQWTEIQRLIQTGLREAPYQTQWKSILDQINQLPAD